MEHKQFVVFLKNNPDPFIIDDQLVKAFKLIYREMGIAAIYEENTDYLIDVRKLTPTIQYKLDSYIQTCLITNRVGHVSKFVFSWSFPKFPFLSKKDSFFP